jgi:hypothetical protein
VTSITFATCVRDREKYAACCASIEALAANGFAVAVEAIDNAANRFSSARALNGAWERAADGFVVFCHEDVVFPRDWLVALHRSLEALDRLPGPWGLAGPMGRAGKRFFGHALDENGAAASFGPLPAAVDTLDELCLIAPRNLPLRFDERLGGHHLYGVDLSIQAVEAGFRVYAIDAPVRHNSRTRHRPPGYHAVKRRLQRKWMFGRRKVGRVIGTTCGRIRFGIFEGWW